MQRRAGKQKGAARMHVAFLRGINVGGKNSLPMKELAALFAQAGCDDVKTLIQSGNVVYGVPSQRARGLPEVIASAILERFGYRVPVVVRTAGELEEVVAHNPYVKAGADADVLHVAFLARVPEGARVAALDPRRSPPDEFVVRGRDIYLRLPNGAGRSKLTNAYFDAKLATTSTIRNWRTILKLVDLSR